MADTTILLTGATGFIGGASLARLLESRADTTLLLHVRAKSPAAAVQRVLSSLTRFVALPAIESRLKSCWVVNGDLTDPASFADEHLGNRSLSGRVRQIPPTVPAAA